MTTLLPRTSALFRALALVFAVLGFGTAITIYHKIVAVATASDPNALAACTINAVLNCVKVSESPYAYLAGIPVSVWGMLFYQFIIAALVALMFGLPAKKWQLAVISAVVAWGLVFSYYLLYMSYFGVGALCIYCLVSTFSATMIALFWFLHLGTARVRNLPE